MPLISNLLRVKLHDPNAGFVSEDGGPYTKQCLTLELDSEALEVLNDDVLCEVLVDDNDELDELLVDVEELDDEPPDDELVDEDGELSELLVDELL